MQYIILVLLVIVTFSGAARADCEDPAGAEGVIIYNSDYKTMQFCNGTHWISMSSILPTGMPKAPSFYLTTDSTYDGSNADEACDSGYHICLASEMAGRSVAPDKGETHLRLSGWVQSHAVYNCVNWTSTEGGKYGTEARMAAMNSTTVGGDLWEMSTRLCASQQRVYCCSD